jgi:hypothetical protein
MHDGSLHTLWDVMDRPFRDNALAHREVLPFEQRVMGPAGLR